MARCDSSVTVEQERLLCLVETQRQHISELRAQLKDLLESQQQQKLQLVQQSPARQRVRRLLEQAAADNTTLANRVEELRAQRNALCVTKAALTAQVSELIRLAADERQLEEQHRLLLHQLSQLCRLIQQPHLCKPEEQVTAVVTHIKQLYRERQELSEKLDAAMRSNSSSSSSPKPQQRPSPIATSNAAAAGPGPSSPTGMRLDQRATSQLIWAATGTHPFTQQKQGQQQRKAQHDAAAGVQQRDCSGNGNVGPAAACDTSSCLDSFSTAQSQLLDMGYISPLRGASSSRRNGGGMQSRTHAPAADTTPCSRAPAAADRGECSGMDAGTPLSAQSLSAFSPGGAAMPSPRMRRALQALSPLRRCGLPAQARGHTATAAEPGASAGASAGKSCASSGCSLAGGGGSSSSSCGVLSDLLTPPGPAGQQQLQQQTWQTPTASSGRGMALPGTACSRLGTPRATPRSGTCGAAFGSTVSVASSSKPGDGGDGGVGGLMSLQPECRVAAADSLWPSPAAARGGSGLAVAVTGPGSAVSSHRLWLQEAEEGGRGCEEGAELASLGDISPRALTDWDFLGWAASSSCAEGAGGDACIRADTKDTTQGGSTAKRRRGVRQGVLGVLRVGLCAAVVAAGGAAAWRHKQGEVRQLAALVQKGAGVGVAQAQRCMRSGLGRLGRSSRKAAVVASAAVEDSSGR